MSSVKIFFYSGRCSLTTVQSKSIRPTVECSLSGAVSGGVIQCFGRPTGDWSILHNRTGALRRISAVAFQHSAQRVLAPRSDFSGRVCNREHMLAADREVDPEQSPSTPLAPIYRGPREYPGDAVEIIPGEMFFIGSADCPTVTIYDRESNRMICAHAGRDCLFDRGALLEGKAPRQYSSVIDTCFAQLGAPSIVFGAVQVWVNCGIRSSFFHPTHDERFREKNQRMVDYFVNTCGPEAVRGLSFDGDLDLHTIVAHQVFRNSPRATVHFDAIDTLGQKDMARSGIPLWYSCRRGDVKSRNGVCVFRPKK